MNPHASNQLQRYPSLYQVNTRVWLTELSQQLGRTATLDDVSDAELDRLAELGFDWIWLLSVWQTGLAGQRVSRGNLEWRNSHGGRIRRPGERCVRDAALAQTKFPACSRGCGRSAHTD